MFPASISGSEKKALELWRDFAELRDQVTWAIGEFRTASQVTLPHFQVFGSRLSGFKQIDANPSKTGACNAIVTLPIESVCQVSGLPVRGRGHLCSEHR
jgi:hypothetical protein